MRISLPPSNISIIDSEFNATISFNEWLQYIDGRVQALHIGVGKKKPLPPIAIVNGQKPTIAFAEWLQYVDRSLALYGPSTTKRKPLPPSNFAVVGVDFKPSIPFAAWLIYADRMLG
jgi:hypothetical protein